MTLKDKEDKAQASVSIQPVTDSIDPAPNAFSTSSFDVEKQTNNCSTNDSTLATYIVPVLDKGVKTALRRPSSRWVRFRVWYNPYRMVRATSTVWFRPQADVSYPAIHTHIHAQHDRYPARVPTQISIRRTARRGHSPRKYRRSSCVSQRTLPPLFVLDHRQAIPEGTSGDPVAASRTMTEPPYSGLLFGSVYSLPLFCNTSVASTPDAPPLASPGSSSF